MISNPLSIVLLFFVYICLSHNSFSQARPVPNDTIQYKIYTDDGNTYIGTIIAQKSGYILLETEKIGTISIQFDHIKKMEKLTGKSETISFQQDPVYPRTQETTYNFAPNGYGLKKGEGYYQNYYLFLNQVNVGITNYFSLGGGISLIPLNNIPINREPINGIPIWLSPKFSIPLVKNKINLGIGSHNGINFSPNPKHFGIIFSNLTFGSRQRNFSLGAGSSYFNDYPNSFAISVSGMYKIGDKAYISGEYYYFEGIIHGSIGGRHMWPKISLEYGAINTVIYDSTIVVPFIGVMIPF